MSFTNIVHVGTNFTARYILQKQDSRLGDAIKCPVCHNDFLVGADEDLPHGWPCLFHIPRVFSKDEEFVEKDELTCPFLMKPLVLPCEFGAASYKDPLVVSFKDFLVDDDGDNTWIAPEKFLQESIKQYSCMLKLNGTTCKYCGDKYEFSYGFDEDSGKFYCNFSCGCISVEGAEDLSRLALGFAREYDKKDKRTDYINAVISRMPKGAKMLGTPTAPSTLNSRTLLDEELSSTDPDLQGELEGLSFLDIQPENEDETYDDGTTAEHPAGKGFPKDGIQESLASPTNSTTTASRGPVDPDRWYIELQSGGAVEDRGLSAVASDLSFISRLFLKISGRADGLEEATKSVQSVFVHSKNTDLDYVAMYNLDTGRATVVPLDTFYSSKISKLSIPMSPTDFDDLFRVFGGLAEDDNKQILDTMERSSTSVVNDEGDMTTTISVQPYETVDEDDDLFLTVLKDISNEEITLFDGMFHDYFKDETRTKPRNIGRISLDLSEGKFDYPSVIGKFESAFKSLENNMYLFTPKVLGELLKELPKDTRVYVPVDTGTQLQGQGVGPGPYTASIVDNCLVLA